jgi:hypothetical protein
VRLSAVGGRQIKAELEGLGEAGSRDFGSPSREIDAANAGLAAFARRARVAIAAAAAAIATAATATKRAKNTRHSRKIARLWMLPDSKAKVERAASSKEINFCNWRFDNAQSKDAELNRWVCLDCGAEGHSRTTAPPVTCKRVLKPRAI